MRIGITVISLILLTSVSLYAETRQDAVLGMVKAIDCKGGEMRMMSHVGEEVVFRLGKDVEYKTVKACEEIKEGYTVVVKFTSEDGRKVVSSVRARPPREAKR